MEVKLILRPGADLKTHSNVVEVVYGTDDFYITEEVIRTDNEDPEWDGRLGPMRYTYKYEDVYMVTTKVDGREVVTSISHKVE